MSTAVEAFVISLSSAVERRAFMKEQLDRLGIRFSLFDGIPGRERIQSTTWYEPAGAVKAEGRELGAGEVGAALSHAGVYKQIVERGLPWALVLEDDAMLHDDLPAVLESLEKGLIEQGDLIFLERCDYLRPGTARRLSGPYRIGVPLFIRAGAAAQAAGYVITNVAAAAIKSTNIPVCFPADSWGHYKGLVRFRGVQPTLTLIRQNTSFKSSIVEGRHRPRFKRHSLAGLLAHDFLTYTAAGRLLQHPLRALFGKARLDRG